MASIHPRKTASGRTRYFVQIRRKGYPPVRATFSTRTRAKEWAKRVEAEMETRRFLPHLEAERRTLAEAIDRYLEDHLSELAAGTQTNRRAELRWWRDRLGHSSLARVTPSAVSDRLRVLKRETSGATCNRRLAALSAVLDRAAKEWAWIEANPCRSIRRYPEGRGRVRWLSDDERTALLKACQESGEPRLYPLALCSLATGARQAEILGLRWQDVDLVNRRAVLHRTKNRDRRTLSFPGKAGDVLVGLSKRPHISGYVFAGASGRPTFPRKAWAAALRASGVKDFRWHDLRHTAASYLAMSGATLPELAAFLGHRSLAVVQRYAHLSEPHSEDVARRMAEKYLG